LVSTALRILGCCFCCFCSLLLSTGTNWSGLIGIAFDRIPPLRCVLLDWVVTTKGTWSAKWLSYIKEVVSVSVSVNITIAVQLQPDHKSHSTSHSAPTTRKYCC
jgi:hypothetical protein